MNGIDRLVNRLSERARVDAAAVAHVRCTTCSPEERLGLTFAPGDAVVDLVTGQKGIIRGGQTEAYLVPSAQR